MSFKANNSGIQSWHKKKMSDTWYIMLWYLHYRNKEDYTKESKKGMSFVDVLVAGVIHDTLSRLKIIW